MDAWSEGVGFQRFGISLTFLHMCIVLGYFITFVYISKIEVKTRTVAKVEPPMTQHRVRLGPL